MKLIGYNKPETPIPHSTINTIQDLVELFSYHFLTGSAKEINVNNE